MQERWKEAKGGKPMSTRDIIDFTKWLKQVNKAEASNTLQINSFQPFMSPVDGSMINSRNDLSNHNKRHNVEQVGNEYVQVVKDKKEEARERTREQQRYN